ncbi:ras-like protein family member 10A isoform X1 [Spea bombifrons]|uniref:ras-like protein family member 10A isoform X1 n=1 Tax=Spea bombifrons TaxID=233779 RepID=UPI0023490F27|nr:ras-like protein family member 10A isoform X1 [Spea bombifrons]
MVQTVQVAVLGAPGVGKTSIIRQFVAHEFQEGYTPTEQRELHRATAVLSGRMYELHILDLPNMPRYPGPAGQVTVNKALCCMLTWIHPFLLFQDWLDPRYRGLRNTKVFILVFDICSPESFHHVKQLKQQIIESSSVPPLIVVVGNKRDQQKQRFAPRHVLSVLVKKNWKCGYLECSARNNWHILLLFKELLISMSARGRSATSSICLQGALHRERCSIM